MTRFGYVPMTEQSGPKELVRYAQAPRPNETRLTDNRADDRSPQWSPDGTKIVFTGNQGQTSYESDILVMNADGTRVKRLTDTAYSEGSLYGERGPVFSPDGPSATRTKTLAPT